MARTIADVYSFMQFITRKELGSFLTIEEAMNALDNAQMDCFEDWYKAYGVNNEVHDALTKFKVTGWFASNSVGFVDLPDACLHLLNLYTVAGSTIYPINWINEDQLATALNSQLRPVVATRPLARDDNDGVQLYPQTVQRGTYIYLRRPVKPVYDYTQVGRVITYVSVSSTQLEFNEVYWNNIVARALVYIGVNMDEDKITAFAEAYKTETA